MTNASQSLHGNNKLCLSKNVKKWFHNGTMQDILNHFKKINFEGGHKECKVPPSL